MASQNNFDSNKVPIEVAIDKAGFGLYSYILTALAGAAIISSVAITYGSTILVPVSACELGTTTAQQGALAAAPVVGAILGILIWGYLADTRGRWSMLLAAVTTSALINMIASISVNWIMLMCLQFIASLMAAGVFSMTMSLMSESIPMAKRNLVVLLVSSISLLAQGIMALLAIPVIPLRFSIELPVLGIFWNSWRTLVIIYSIPSILTGIWLYFMQESPKYVFTQGDEQRALNILKIIHKVNHLGSKEEYLVTGILEDPMDVKAEKSSSKDQIVPLFKAPLLKYTIIMTILFLFQQTNAFLVWFPTIANQVMSVLENGEGTDLTLCGILGASTTTPVDPDAVPCALNDTAMLLVFLVATLQAVVNFLISLFVNKVGRRNMVIGITSICGISGILVNLVPNAIGSIAFYVIQVMGMTIIGMYAAIIVALFPTQLRATALAIPLMGGRMATFASIQILNVMLVNSCDAGFYLFGSIFASSSLIALLLPDDRKLAAKPPAPATEKEIQS